MASNISWARALSQAYTNELFLSGFACITTGYLVNNFHEHIGNDVFVTKFYFQSLSVGLFLISLSQISSKKYTWLLLSLMELCAYNILDEALGRACIADPLELVGAILLLVYNYLRRNK